MERKICWKCLLEDMDQKDYFENLRRLIDGMEEELRTPEKVYRERLLICKECKFLADAMCGACGCFVELRAATARQRCPYDKWQAWEEI